MKNEDMYFYLENNVERERAYLEWEEYEEWKNMCQEEFKGEKKIKFARIIKVKEHAIRQNNKLCNGRIKKMEIKSESSFITREFNSRKGNRKKFGTSGSGKEIIDFFK